MEFLGILILELLILKRIFAAYFINICLLLKKTICASLDAKILGLQSDGLLLNINLDKTYRKVKILSTINISKLTKSNFKLIKIKMSKEIIYYSPGYTDALR